MGVRIGAILTQLQILTGSQHFLYMYDFPFILLSLLPLLFLISITSLFYVYTLSHMLPCTCFSIFLSVHYMFHLDFLQLPCFTLIFIIFLCLTIILFKVLFV